MSKFLFNSFKTLANSYESEVKEYDETYDGPPSSDHFGQVWRKSEMEADLYSEEHDIRTVKVRFGNILAHGGYIQDVYKVDSNNRVFFNTLGSGTQWHPWIHVVDAVNMIVDAIENEERKGVCRLLNRQPLGAYH